MSKFYTIGYEGATIEGFIQTIIAKKINVLADVRELPLSRKRGFSKRALAERLSASGITYLHLPALGDPKEGRLAARAGQYNVFRRVYRQHLGGVEAQAALLALADQISLNIICLMCFEREPAECHRTIIADRLTGLVPAKKVDLYVGESTPGKPLIVEYTRSRARESAATA